MDELDRGTDIWRPTPLSGRSNDLEDNQPSLPPFVRADLEAAAVAPRPWYTSIAPAYLGLFIWAAFFDQLWSGDVPRHSLGFLCASAVAAPIACFALLYLLPAMWGYRTGRRLPVVAASAFGIEGSEWISGLLVAVANVVCYAVALDFGLAATFQGLRVGGFIGGTSLSRWMVGPLSVRSPVYLSTAIYWIFIINMATRMRLTKVVAGLMKVYSPVALALLVATALWSVAGIDWSLINDPSRAANKLATVPSANQPGAFAVFFGFFAMAGLISIDWGSTARRPGDIALGGLVGIVATGSMTAILSLLVLLGAMGAMGHAAVDGQFAAGGTEFAPLLSFRWAVSRGIGGYVGGLILVLFGLASLAPACYAAYTYSRVFSIHWPRLRPPRAARSWRRGCIRPDCDIGARTPRRDLLPIGRRLRAGRRRTGRRLALPAR